MKIKVSISALITTLLWAFLGTGIALARVPSVSIDADDTSIDFRDSTIIRWDSDDADDCEASGGDNGWDGDIDTSGTFRTGPLTDTTTFYIDCTNDDGSDGDSVTVRVDEDNNNGTDLDVTTKSATNIDQESATLNGEVDAKTSSEDVTVWFEWGTSSNYFSNQTNEIFYTSANNRTFRANIDNLFPGDTYYFRAVAENEDGEIFYGARKSFTTDRDRNDNRDCDFYSCGENQPSVTTLAASRPNETFSYAVLNGYVNTDGFNTIRWFEWGTMRSYLPYNTIKLSQGTNSGNFSQMISDLKPNTTYYFRAVAQSSGEPDYGNVLSFYTGNYVAPVYNPPQNVTPITIPITTSPVPTITIPVKINPIVTPVVSPAPAANTAPAKQPEVSSQEVPGLDSLLQGAAYIFGDDFLPDTLFGWIILALLVALLLLTFKKLYKAQPSQTTSHLGEHR